MPEVIVLLDKWLSLVGCSSASSNQSCRIRRAKGINRDLQPRNWQLVYRYGGKLAILRFPHGGKSGGLICLACFQIYDFSVPRRIRKFITRKFIALNLSFNLSFNDLCFIVLQIRTLEFFHCVMERNIHNRM